VLISLTVQVLKSSPSRAKRNRFQIPPNSEKPCGAGLRADCNKLKQSVKKGKTAIDASCTTATIDHRAGELTGVHGQPVFIADGSGPPLFSPAWCAGVAASVALSSSRPNQLTFCLM
jgi:hypothetical protein